MTKKRFAIGFIILSILFIGTLCGIYGYRLIHYYKLENGKIEGTVQLLLKEELTDASKIVVSGDGLYKDDEGYYWKGNATNNYVSYSGITWRAIRTNKDDSVTLISEETLTSLVYGYQVENFKDSYVYNWLNNDFYKALVANEIIVDTVQCTDKIEDEKNVNCKNEEKNKVGMISINEYLKAGGSKSYLNNKKSFWTVNPSVDYKTWFVNQEGLITNSSVSGESYHSYGVRPVITIKGSAVILNGDGTKESPYQITKIDSSVLKDKTIGSYISYSDQIWRIIETDETGVKVALNGTLKNGEEDYLLSFSNSSNIYTTAFGIGYYLNSTYFSSLKNSEYLVDHNWEVKYYNSNQKYNYTDNPVATVTAKVGLLQVGDLFLDDFSGYTLLTAASSEEGTIFMVKEDGRLFADFVTTALKVRPVVVLKNDLNVISGSGSLVDPFVLGE